MSKTEQELLHRAGIDVAVADPDSAIRAACLRAAQQIQRLGCRSVGLLPASADVGVVGIGVNLAVALAELSGSTIAYVDANLRWPALARTLGELAAPIEDPSDPAADSPFSTRWLRGDVALLVPREHAATGAGLVALSKVLDSAHDLFARSLVDLTGWQRLGEHLSAFARLDGVVVVAKGGETTEDELLLIGEEIPPERHLGVLLLRAEPAL